MDVVVAFVEIAVQPVFDVAELVIERVGDLLDGASVVFDDRHLHPHLALRRSGV